jgi:HrpA-like RNA helicase
MRVYFKHSTFRGIQTLTLGWISQSSSIQRKGRCGRVKPGVCVSLYTKEFMSSQREHELPEIAQLSLEKTILQVKNLFPNDSVVELMTDLVVLT